MNQRSIETFSAFLKTKGYAEQTIHSYSKALEIVSDTWDTDDPNVLYEHINSTLKTLEPTLKTSTMHNIRAAARQFFFLKTGTIYKDYVQKTNTQSGYADILNDFFIYSTEFKRITSESTKSECQHIKAFLCYLGDTTYESLSKLKAHDIRDYVCIAFQDLTTSSIGRYVTSLRNFFRFLEYKGYPINESLIELPLAPADWAKGKVPVVLTKDEEKRLRDHHPVNQKNDNRNRIIILLMLDLGMRCSEVANLKLTDISWSKGTIKLHDTKNAHDRELPLPSSLGHMIEIYILSERPKVKIDMLFIRKYLHSYLPMNLGCVRRVVREAFQKENISGWWKGSHALRRTAASHIYNSGIGLKLTADLLGHESIDSTTAYVKVDFDSLRSVAVSWPGGDSNE
ncbi:tyrosine-type recombinase/integrase [Anaerocolumna sedimenticola]|uniref:Tyrosine-type recombinase/integrase n=1 Tax=Anaerocolumna sedimenticola TaxID=2696063 RepID=A0A6P1TNW0_9FIRM|nr:tyrosine-type recombinase/integrase [Anaerocolumna sedimenticola]QHQ61068.1 tyrosine-type recombinase/integrase [Anaerocolumna sedimenticola]